MKEYARWTVGSFGVCGGDGTAGGGTGRGGSGDGDGVKLHVGRNG